MGISDGDTPSVPMDTPISSHVGMHTRDFLGAYLCGFLLFPAAMNSASLVTVRARLTQDALGPADPELHSDSRHVSWTWWQVVVGSGAKTWEVTRGRAKRDRGEKSARRRRTYLDSRYTAEIRVSPVDRGERQACSRPSRWRRQPSWQAGQASPRSRPSGVPRSRSGCRPGCRCSR